MKKDKLEEIHRLNQLVPSNWKMVELMLLDRVECSKEEKMECLPLIRKGFDFVHIARTAGILALSGSYIPEWKWENPRFKWERRTDISQQHEFTLFELWAYAKLMDGFDEETLREIMLSYILSSHFQGKRLLESLIVYQTILWVQRGSYNDEDKDRIAVLFGEEMMPNVKNVFVEIDEKLEQERRDRWRQCAKCKDKKPCHRDRMQSEYEAITRLNKIVTKADDKTIAQLIGEIITPFEPAQKFEVASPIVWSLAFKVLDHCATIHKLKHFMSDEILDAIYEAGWNLQICNLKDCLRSCQEIGDKIKFISKIKASCI